MNWNKLGQPNKWNPPELTPSVRPMATRRVGDVPVGTPAWWQKIDNLSNSDMEHAIFEMKRAISTDPEILLRQTELADWVREYRSAVICHSEHPDFADRYQRWLASAKCEHDMVQPEDTDRIAWGDYGVCTKCKAVRKMEVYSG